LQEENIGKIKELNRTIIEQETIIKTIKAQMIETQKESNVNREFL